MAQRQGRALFLRQAIQFFVEQSMYIALFHFRERITRLRLAERIMRPILVGSQPPSFPIILNHDTMLKLIHPADVPSRFHRGFQNALRPSVATTSASCENSNGPSPVADRHTADAPTLANAATPTRCAGSTLSPQTTNVAVGPEYTSEPSPGASADNSSRWFDCPSSAA